MIIDFLKEIKSIKNIINKDNIVIKNTNDNFNIITIATDFLQGEKSLFVVLPSLFEAQRYYDELINIIDSEDILFYPADELITAEIIMSSSDFKYERINTIYELTTNEKKLVITNFNGAVRYLFSSSHFLEFKMEINKNDIIDIDFLTSKLIDLGYKNVYTTTKTGEFSKRGSIVDIFLLNSQQPIRIDFFDDEIESIRYFDFETQKSISYIDSFTILPVSELVYNNEMLDKALINMDNFLQNYDISEEELVKFNEDRVSLINKENLDSLTRYISFFTEDKQSLFDLVDNKKIYLINKYKLEKSYDSLVLDLNQYCSSIGGYNIFNLNYFMDINKLFRYGNVVTLSNLENKDKAEEINVLDSVNFSSNTKDIITYFTKFYKNKIIICFVSDKTRLTNLRNLLIDNNVYFQNIDNIKNIKKNQINIINSYNVSFDLVDESIVFFNEKNIYEVKYEKRKVKYKSIYQNSTKISRYDELEVGDYVVHYDYGIGRYLGVYTMTQNNLKRDYIHVEYAKTAALYVPLEQVNLIQKYAAKDTYNVKLSDMGTTAWTKAKLKVRKKIHDISANLIKLYAARQVAEGYAFSDDSDLQLEFENDFTFELTVDQYKAICDVKKDMMSTKPMDRLICGDVGYGKTEVALRACFKAVLDGKQVCVLAPTTILSRQHYLLFKNRMEKYGVNVELLNRFVSPSKQKEVMDGVKSGFVDIVVGTHRVLSKELCYKDLGLLVIDEEQRFGVTHKEKIKELKVNIDTITLSATPIPRTLQMSIVGLKDFSMIETPPKNRYPVQTYVVKRNDSIIKEAITRELARGGQVFYMYNRVDTILEVAADLAKLVPEARICVGHGRLTKDKLEKTLTSFIDKEYDVLVCTTIIETGIDIPDTNTLIIHDADRLGLSQLYQIRGRVGRSDKIAYAYMMYDGRDLNDNALKRLEAIKELTDLGSGYKIAMRDLSIRGAGDLLGDEQSGFVESVGIDMYLKILEEEINERKGIVNQVPVVKNLTNVLSQRHINDNYIENEDIKIEIHKKIDLLSSIDEFNELCLELKDRFGEFDSQLETYMFEKLFRNLCNKLDILKIDDSKLTMTLYMSKDSSDKMDGNFMFSEANKLSSDISLKYFNRQIIITIKKSNDYLNILCKYLNVL